VGREAKPWYRESRGAWYTKHEGRQVPLARGPKDETEAEAKRAFHRLKAGLDRSTGETAPAGPAVGELIVQFLDHAKAEHKPSTYAYYRHRLRMFADRHADSAAKSITPHDVIAWARQYGTSPTYRRNTIAAVKALFAWSRLVGLIAADPVADTPKPAARRRAIPGREAVARLLEGTEGTPLGDLLKVLHETGCRLQDARRIEARHVRWEAGVAILPEHKTDGTTGRPKVIPLTDRALELLRRLADRWPSGPLLRNTRDEPWTQSAVSQAVQHRRARLGLGPEATPHGLRHRFVTDAVAVLSRPVVAATLGYRGTDMIDRVYDHTGDALTEDAAALRRAAEAVRGSAAPSPPAAPMDGAGPAGETPGPGPSARNGAARARRPGRRGR
jgi:integrase